MSVAKTFNITYDHNRRMEIDAKMNNKTLTEWINCAIGHYLQCKENMPNQRLHKILTAIETTCVCCQKTIPPFRLVMYSANLGGGLCTECYLQRFGDNGRLANIMIRSELKEDIRVANIELTEKTKEVQFLNHQVKLDQVLNGHIESEKRYNEVLKNSEKVLNIADSYFKATGFAKDEELKSIIDAWKKQMDTTKDAIGKFEEQIETTQPLVRDVQDFDKRYFLERIKKKKTLKEVSEEYS